MDATISWRKIGDWVLELGGTTPLPILDLIKLDALQAGLRRQWPNCKVTHDKRSLSAVVIREVPYKSVAPLLTYLAATYPTHPITGDRISWNVGEMIS